MATTVTLTGTDALAAKLARLSRSLPAVAGVALFREAERIMKAAQDRTPVDTGALRASGQVLQPEVTGTTATVTMGFGNAAVKYAVFVHENLMVHHPVGEAKFLERPLNEARAGMEGRLATDVRAEIERLAGTP